MDILNRILLALKTMEYRSMKLKISMAEIIVVIWNDL